jgi:uncharacterized membrane protein
MLRRVPRLLSIDLMRGVVMVLMALDHVRVYSGLPAGGPTPGIFFTRWVTHFCAPAFVFFAGTAAFLHGRKLGDTGRLARFLITRGLVLVLLELTIIRVMWTFNVDYAHYILAGVIWMLGWCMILLAALLRLRAGTIASIGLLVIFAHPLIGVIAGAMTLGSWGWIWQFLYFGGEVPLGEGGPVIGVLYSIVPWIGVMAAGYAFGAIMIREPAERHRQCVRIGCSAIALFLILRAFDVYGDPRPWRDGGGAPALVRFLNTSKYPASPLFLLMTLGPAIALLPLAERAHNIVGRVLVAFGRVPMFYYLLHIPLIHIAAIAVSLVREGRVNPWLFGNHPYMPPELPEGYMWSLPLLYLVTVIVVALLYIPCRWFAAVKERRPDLRWLGYI